MKKQVNILNSRGYKIYRMLQHRIKKKFLSLKPGGSRINKLNIALIYHRLNFYPLYLKDLQNFPCIGPLLFPPKGNKFNLCSSVSLFSKDHPCEVCLHLNWLKVQQRVIKMLKVTDH